MFGGIHIWLSGRVREGHPLKQGLKHNCRESGRALDFPVREGHPLKQGLKRNGERFWEEDGYGSGRTSTKTRIETVKRDNLQPAPQWVREGHPLKQGLKPGAGITEVGKDWRSGRTSTKTRIETE